VIFKSRKGGSFCLEDEQTRSLWEEPRFVMTVGFGEGAKGINSSTPSAFASFDEFWY
jgi:hypothetical protein